MRRMIFTAGITAVLAIGCKDDSTKPTTPSSGAQTPKPPANVQATASPTEIAKTRAPNTDKKDIQGVWQTAADSKEEPIQMEFTSDEVTIRSGPGPNWKQTTKASYTLRNELAPSQIDWGTGADGGYGLYTIDGKNLVILYGTGRPENRPKKFEPSKSAKLVMLERPK